MEQELVSINIPTYNSERTLEKTLKSVKNQTYKNMEIIIIDSYSKDGTLKIAIKYGCKIEKCHGKLLEARIVGAKASKGKFILLLDSDQILEKTTIERSVKKMENHGSLWLYERSLNGKKLLPSLYDADRILTQKHLEEGVVLPRFFKKSMLIEAYNKIPKKYISICAAQDHIIAWHEYEKISNKIGKIENAVKHREPENFIELFRKQFRWGKTTKDFYKAGIYRELITKKDKLRGFYFEDFGLSIKANILRILRGIPYKLGFWFN